VVWIVDIGVQIVDQDILCGFIGVIKEVKDFMMVVNRGRGGRDHCKSRTWGIDRRY
jgi:hypothetical protein